MTKGPAPFDQGLFLMHLHKGKEYFDQNQLHKAREELESAHNLRPQDEKVLNMLGMAYYKLEMLPQAEEMYIALADRNPDIYTLQSNLGLIRLKLEKLDQARESLHRALELQPTNPKAHFYLGLLYEKQQRWEDALYHFEMAKADKMVSKMRAKLAEEKMKQAYKPRPFEVLQVLTEATTESDPFPEALNPPSAYSDIPGKTFSPDVFGPSSRSADLSEMVAGLEEEAVQLRAVAEEEDAEPAGEPGTSEQSGAAATAAERTDVSSRKIGFADTERLKLQELLKSVIPQEESDEPQEAEELVADENGTNGEIRETDPEHGKQYPEVTIPVPSSDLFFPSPPDDFPTSSGIVDGAFFLHESAADISTFLAESRTEKSSEEEPYSFDAPVLKLISNEAKPVTDESVQPEVESVAEEQQTTEYQPPIAPPDEVEREQQAETKVESVSVQVASEKEPVAEEDLSKEQPDPGDAPAEQEESAAAMTSDIPENEENPATVEQNIALVEQEVESTQTMLPSLLESYRKVLMPPEEPTVAEVSAQAPEEAEATSEVAQDSDTDESVAADQNSAPHSVEVATNALEPQQETQTVELPSEPGGSLADALVSVSDEAQPAVEVVAEEEEEREAVAPEPLSVDGAAETVVATVQTEVIRQERLPYRPAKLDQMSSRDRMFVAQPFGADRFLLVDPRLLEVMLSEKVVCRSGTISSYTGSLQFSTRENVLQEKLVDVRGTGVLFLADHRKDIVLLSLNEESICVESRHLLVAQSTLSIEPCAAAAKDEEGDRFSYLQISGTGTIAITCQTRALTIHVTSGSPACIPAQSLIAWSGDLRVDIVNDRELRKILMNPADPFLQFSGNGEIVVEQGSLSGDFRSKRL